MTNFLVGSVEVSKIGSGQGVDPTGSAGAVDFNPEKFNDLIRSKGMPVVWEKSLLCPNRVQSPTPGDHDPTCDICTNGYVYIDPKDTVMAVQGASLEQAFYMQGRFDSGVAQITSLATDQISYWDKVTLKSSIVRYTDLIRRRKGSVEDLMRYPVVQIVHVQSKKRVFKENQDFKFKDNKIVWTPSAAGKPADGEYYSVIYLRRPVYIIMDLIKQHRDVPDNVEGGTKAMPLQATARLDFLLRDESKDPQPIAPESPFEGK